MNKLIVKIIKNNEIESSKTYKSLKAVQLDYPDYTYHALRQIYLQSSGIEPRRMHQTNQLLFSQFRIIDSPKVFKRIEVVV